MGCEVTPDNYEPEPNIYTILTPDSFAQVMVGRTATINDTVKVKTVVVFDTFWDFEDEDTVYYVDTITVPLWNGVTGAEVILKHGEESFSLTEDSTGYYSDSLSFHPGETWELEVDIPGEDLITAQTTFPDSFEIISPAERLVDESDTLEWTQPAGVKGYQLGVFMWLTEWGEDTTYIDSLTYILWDFLPPDSTRVPIMDIVGRLFNQPQIIDSFTVSVTALDTNIYDYRLYHRNLYYDPFSEDDSLKMEDVMHIDGALGVFGSQTAVRSQVHQYDWSP